MQDFLQLPTSHKISHSVISVIFVVSGISRMFVISGISGISVVSVIFVISWVLPGF